jgi:acyl-CoA dehydrogenase
MAPLSVTPNSFNRDHSAGARTHINILMLLLSRTLRPVIGARIATNLASRRLIPTRHLSTQIDSITDSLLSETQLSVRQSIQKLCAQFPDDYWAEADRTSTYPIEFRKAITAGGWLGIALPAEFGGAGLGVSEAVVMMQTIAESGAGVAGAQSIHANIYPLVPVAKFGTKEQHDRWLGPLIEGEHTACFGVTEPDVGSETYKLKTRAVKKGDKYIVNGQKM